MAYTVEYSSRFIRTLRKLPPALQEEIFEKVTLLQDPESHPGLRVHKLSGRLQHIWSFSVNYRIRITFAKIGETLILETVGTHDEVY